VGLRKQKFNRIRQVAPMCPHGKAHWRHLANTIEPSVCGGDAVLRQIILTTCYIYVQSVYQEFFSSSFRALSNNNQQHLGSNFRSRYYGRPASQMRTLYFCPVVSFYLFLFLA